MLCRLFKQSLKFYPKADINLNHSVKPIKIMSTKRKLEEQPDNLSKKPNSKHWSLGLLDSMKDPDNVIQEDDLVTTIKDKYPKAQFHYLVIPKETINSLKSINKSHGKLLKHMEEVGQKIVADSKHIGKKFNLGYHNEASMARLHLHVISDDMDSVCVKTKKHWNSFNTTFFIDSRVVREQLEKEGKITLLSPDSCKKLLNTPLKCHKCDFVPKHMPDLKKHIVGHI